jgi:hypothetical protein
MTRRLVTNKLSWQQGTVYAPMAFTAPENAVLAAYLRFNHTLLNTCVKNGLCHPVPVLGGFQNESTLLVCVESGCLWLVEHLLGVLAERSALKTTRHDKLLRAAQALVANMGSSPYTAEDDDDV